jgi:phosphonate degradation associated HDIG domain protein
MTIADEIVNIFSDKGQSSYFGEPVSQLEHALQTAFFAQQEQAPPHLVVAALVHDIGHLVEDTPENIADQGVDARHEESGEQWLKARFGPEVFEPVHLHVRAKRYLCATDPAYLGKLSPASIQSLALQGGPMSPGEVQEFEANPFYREAVRLRLWDDRAKIEGLSMPALTSYRALIESVSGCPAENKTINTA